MLDIQVDKKNWPEIEFVKVSGDFIVKQNCQGIGWAQAFQSRYHRILMSLEIYQGTAWGQFKPHEAFLLTARQYGKVVLPDDSTGQGPGTLARKLSRCKEGMAHFLQSRYKFCKLYACRGTSLIGAANLSPVTKLVAGTGAVLRYNLSRSQKSVTAQDLFCGQMHVSGCKNYYKSV